MDIHESVEFLLSHQQTVIEQFYARFLDEYPQVRPYFAGIELQQQALMLTMALVAVEAYYTGGYPATEHYLRVLGHRHHLANVKPEHYPLFRDCLVETLADIHDEEWDDELAAEWHAAIDTAVDAMLQGYVQPYIF